MKLPGLNGRLFEEEKIISLALPFIVLLSQLFYGSADFSGKYIFSVILGIYSLWIIAFLRKKGLLFTTGFLNLFFLLLVLLVIYLAVNAVNMAEVKNNALNSFLYYALFIGALVALMQIEPDRYYVNLIIFVLGLLQIVFCVLDLFNKSRITGSYFAPDILGDYFILTFFCGVSLIKYFKRTLKVCIFFSLAVIFVLIIFTASRGAFISLIFAVILFAVFSRNFHIPVLIALMAIVILFFVNNPLKEKMVQGVKKDPFLWERAGIWRSSVKLFGERPVFGAGLSNYRYAISRYREPSRDYFAKFSRRAESAHNIYLTGLNEIGLAGMLILAFACIVISRYYRPKEEVFGILGILFHNLFNDSLAIPGIMFPFALVVIGSLKFNPVVKKEVRGIPMAILWLAVTVLLGWGLLFQNETIYLFKNRYNVILENVTLSYRLSFLKAHRLALRYNKSKDPEILKRYIDKLTLTIARNPYKFEARKDLINFLSQFASDENLKNDLYEQIGQLLEHDPFNVFHYEFAAEIMLKTGEKAKAKEYLKKAVELEPNFARAIVKLSRMENSNALYKTGMSIYKEYFPSFSAIVDGEPVMKYEYELLYLNEKEMKR